MSLREVFTDRLRKFHVPPSRGSYRRRMIRASLLAAASLMLVVAAAPAIAAPSKGAQVPAFTLNLLQHRFGDQTYAPTRIPVGYRYSRWQRINDSLVLTFKEGTSTDTFRFEVSKLAPAAPCDGGGAFHRIIQTDGNKIYYGGDKGYWKAWRCVVSPKTQTRYVLTALSNGKLSDIALAQVGASGKRFAKP